MISPKLFVFLAFGLVYVAAAQSDTEISSTLMELTKRLELTEVQVQGLKSQNEALRSELESVKKSLQTVVVPAVAFSATLQTQQPHEFLGPFQEDYTLKYGNVITNVGSAYDPNTGMFTVPMRGVYFFTFVVFHPVGHPSKTASGVMLMKNGEMVVSVTDNVPGADTEDTATNAVTLVLEVSDKVYIAMHTGRSIYTDGNRRNTFSGHLLYTV